MTYDELRSQFEGLLKRRDMTTTQRDAFLDQAIARIQRELRIPPMEKTAIVNVEGYDSTGIEVPNDLIELKDISVGSSRLRRVDLQTALRLEECPAGVPQVYTRVGGAFRFGPPPSEGSQIQLNYYAEFAPLVNGSDESTLTRIAPDLIIYGALSYAADWFLDKRSPQFEARYQQILQTLQQQADRDELSAAAAMAPTYTYPDDDL